MGNNVKPDDPDKDDKPIKTLSEEDVRIMSAYGAGPYSAKIKKLEADVKEVAKRVNEVAGIKESDTGLAHPSRWDLVSDKQAQQEEHPLQVRRRCRGAVVGQRCAVAECSVAGQPRRARLQQGAAVQPHAPSARPPTESPPAAAPSLLYQRRWRGARRSSTPTPTRPSM